MTRCALILALLALFVCADGQIFAGFFGSKTRKGGDDENGACHFRGEGPGSSGRRRHRFVHLREDAEVGSEILRVRAHPRRQINVQAIDGSRPNDQFVGVREVDRHTIALTLRSSLQDLVDSSTPTNSLQFRLACRGSTGDTDYLPVTIYIGDINDNKPEFVNTPYRVTIDEDAHPGLPVFRGISAIDRDKPGSPNSEIGYTIVGGNEDRKFTLQARSKSNAVLVLRKELDYDAGDRRFNITIRATDNGNPPLHSEAAVEVLVADGDDRGPKFTRSVYRTQIWEDFPITGEQIQDQVVFNPPIHAFDQDEGIGATLHYSIIKGNDDGYFSIDPTTGLIYRVKQIDYEAVRKKSFTLEIEAKQKNNQRKAITAKAEIDLLDANDHAPRFGFDRYNLTVAEDAKDGVEMVRFRATDPDTGDGGVFTYVLQSDPSGLFSVDAVTGALSLSPGSSLDRETQSVHHLVIGTREEPEANLAGEEAGRVEVRVDVADRNDNEPRFIPGDAYSFRVPSGVYKKALIGRVEAVDEDEGRNGLVRYRVRGGSGSGLFGVDATTGQIRVRLDAENLHRDRYTLLVSATDQAERASERLTSLARVEITVSDDDNESGDLRDYEEDAHDIGGGSLPIGYDDVDGFGQGTRGFAISVGKNVPKRSTPAPPGSGGSISFPGSLQYFEVARSGRKGLTIGQILVDNPRSEKLNWAMRHRYRHGVPFGIDRNVGKIGLVKDVGTKALESYYLRVQVESESGDLASTEIQIRVVPDKIKLEVKPIKDEYSLKVKENLEGALVANLSYYLDPDHVQAVSDPQGEYIIVGDEEAKTSFSITDSGLLFTKVALDREQKDSFQLNIVRGVRGVPVIRGLGKEQQIMTVKVSVEDENDNSPSFDRHIYQGQIASDARPGKAVDGAKIRVADPDLEDKVEMKLLGKAAELFKIEDGAVVVAADADIAKFLDLDGEASQKLKELRKKKEVDKIYLRIRATDQAGHITESQLVIHVIPAEEEDEDAAEDAAPAPPEPPKIKGVRVINAAFVNLRGKDSLSVKEECPVGTRLARLEAIADDGKNENPSKLRFSINFERIRNLRDPRKRNLERLEEQDLKKGHFTIEPNSGDLLLLRPLSSSLHYTLNITVSAIGDNNNNDSVSTAATTAAVEIEVEDANDHAPKFQRNKYKFRLKEGHYVDHLLGHIKAIDEDIGDNARVKYKLVPGRKARLPFWLDPESGSLYVNGSVDYEREKGYSFEAVATDSPSSSFLPLTSSVLIQVDVADANDHPPKFRSYHRLAVAGKSEKNSELVRAGLMQNGESIPVYESEITVSPEDSGSVEVARVMANDSDSGANGKVKYRLLTGGSHFRIDSKTGVISTKRTSTPRKRHKVYVEASDRGFPSRRSYALVLVRLDNSAEEVEAEQGKEQDHAVKSKKKVKVPVPKPSVKIEKVQKESKPVATIEKVQLDHDDAKDDVEQEETTKVVMEEEEDDEEIKLVELQTQRIERLFLDKHMEISVAENTKAPAQIVDLRRLLLDPALDADLEFEMMEGDSTFRINKEELMLVNTLDRERQDKYYLRIRASMRQPRQVKNDDKTERKEVPILFYTLVVNKDNDNLVEDELELIVNVLDSNDNAPEFLTKMEKAVTTNTHVGTVIIKLEAFDADASGSNSDVRYFLVDRGQNYPFDLDPLTGELRVARTLSFNGGKTFHIPVVARDRRGSNDGLSSKTELMIHVVDSEHQLKMVLDSSVDEVMKDMKNITKALSEISGFEVHSHSVQPRGSSSLDLSRHHDEKSTDVYLYALESNGLVETDRMIRSLSNQLTKAKTDLAPHNLVEVRAGSYVLSPESSLARRGLGSLEIVLLGLACAVFFGALIAVITVVSLRYRRSQLSKYPAPLAIPLGPGSPPGAQYHPPPPPPPVGTPGVHHRFPAFITPGPHSAPLAAMTPTSLHARHHHSRQQQHQQQHHKLSSSIPIGSSSEETSDTCLDDRSKSPDRCHLHQQHHQRHQDELNNRRLWSRSPGRRESEEMLLRGRRAGTVGPMNNGHSGEDSTCDSCSECQLESTLHTYSHFARHPSHLGHRRHKSASPTRRSQAGSSVGRRGGQVHGYAQPHYSGGQHHGHRSKSAGGITFEQDMDCPVCVRQSQKSLRQQQQQQRCHHCCCSGDCYDYDWKRSKSARSTRWEVYHREWEDDEDERRQKSMTFDHLNREMERGDDNLRVASSTAYKAHSWRGDHPMKNPHNHHFEHEPRRKIDLNNNNSDDKDDDEDDDEDDENKISMPFRTTHTYNAYQR